MVHLDHEEYLEEADLDLAAEHLLNKEKRYISMERQQHHKQHLLNELSQNCTHFPFIIREAEFDTELDDYIWTNRIKRARDSQAQQFLKKVAKRQVRHLPLDALPPKGNYYRKIYDYWWTLI